MTKKQFKDLITENTGLSYAEYDDIVAALKKYDVDIESAASQIDVSPSLVGLAMPDTSNQNVPYTAQDKILADKLDLDVETVSKFTTWAEAFGKKIDKFDDLPFGIGDKVTEAINSNGLSEYIGPNHTKADIAGNINAAIDAYERTHGVETGTTAEGATQNVVTETIEEKIENRKDNTVDNGFAAMDTEAGYKLEAKGDKMYVYDLKGEANWFSANANTEPKLVATVDCPANQREEFLSEFKEGFGDVNENGFARNFQIARLAEDVSKEIKEENTFSTGDKLTDIAQALTEKKEEELSEKLEKLQDSLKALEGKDGWFNDSVKKMLTTAIGETQEELDKCHVQLEKYEALEVENAKEMKEKLEKVQQGLQDELAKVQGIETNNPLQNMMNNLQENQLVAQLDEVGDRIAAIDAKIANAPQNTFTQDELNDVKPVEQVKDALNDAKEFVTNTLSKVDDHIDNIKDSIGDKLEDAAKDAKAGIQGFVVRVDNLIDDWKEDIVAWGKSIAEKPAVQAAIDKAQDVADDIAKNPTVKEFVDNVKEIANKVEDKLEPVIDYAKDIGTKIKEEVNERVEDAKEALSDAKDWISDKWNSFKNLFSKDDDVEMDIDD